MTRDLRITPQGEGILFFSFFWHRPASFPNLIRVAQNAEGDPVTRVAFWEIHLSVVDVERPSGLLLLHRPHRSACNRPSGMIDPNMDSSHRAAQFALA